jgi:hypothetical protein
MNYRAPPLPGPGRLLVPLARRDPSSGGRSASARLLKALVPLCCCRPFFSFSAMRQVLLLLDGSLHYMAGSRVCSYDSLHSYAGSGEPEFYTPALAALRFLPPPLPEDPADQTRLDGENLLVLDSDDASGMGEGS